MKMDFDFSGKRVLVTGADSGVGLGAAAAFLAHGATVALHGANQAAVDQAVASLDSGERLFGFASDLAHADGCRDLVAGALMALGGLDVLVNAAPPGASRSFAEVGPDDWAAGIGVSFKAATFCTQQAVPGLRASRGNVVNVASVLGLMGSGQGASVHSAAMGSIVNMTRMAALRFGADGIRVNCLCPGALANAGAGDPLSNEVPSIGRLGTVDDMAGTILFLASRHAGYMTGSIIVNDGGKYAGS
jgi:NAD(P)-dependent dehydrogenase (short-subunit alcohol dehydrogenase family)